MPVTADLPSLRDRVALPMIAAIYARKSTEQRGMTDEERSVTRQIDHATAYATRKGWTVAEDHVYVDDGISGAEFVKRPGLARLMNALRPHPPFQTVVMSEESRFGREQIETAYLFKQITDAGVRVFFYLEDRERTLDSALDKVMLSLTNFAAEMEREKARQRTYDAMLRKAKAGYVASGKVYGYDNVEVVAAAPGTDDKGTRLHVVRRVNEEQAAVVRRIFELCAGGKGFTRIAKALNQDGVTPPRNDGRGWAPTAVREMLYRPLYRGQIVWNKSQKIDRGGTKKQRRRSPEEWIQLDAPELRIVPEDLWEAAHTRLEQARQTFARAASTGQLLGRPSRLDLDSPYLLTGMARCARCGGAMIAMTRSHGKKRGHFYGCTYNHKRGAAICSNDVQIRQEVLDLALLDAIGRALDERIVEAAIDEALERLRSGREEQLDRRLQIERELSLIEGKQRILVEAVVRGQSMDPLLVAMRGEEHRKKLLMIELATLAELEKVASLDAEWIKRELRKRVADVRALLGRRTPQARQILRKLVVGRVMCEPFEDGDRRGYRVSGQGTYARLLPGGESATSIGGSNGIRTRVSALRGPCPRPD
jgi:site-specific DNA recombinase